MKKTNEKGSVTLFIVVSIVFFLIVLVLIYSQQTEKITVQKKQVAEIQKNYQTKNIEQIYQKTYDKNKPKPAPTGIWVALVNEQVLTFYTTRENAIKSGGKLYDENLKGKEFTRDNNTEKVNTPWFEDRDKITVAEFVDPVAPEYMAYFFSDLDKLRIVNMENVEMGNVTNMYGLFLNCRELRTIKTSEIDTSSVTNMGWMFLNCSNLTDLDVSKFDTSKVTNMYAMFNGCKSLRKLDVSNFDTSNVTDMGSMFANLTLNQLNLSNFDTSNVTNMVTMFYNSKGLYELDLSSFDTRKVTSMRNMFHFCSSLRKIYVGRNWKLAPDTYQMFQECGTSSTILK